jgi:histidine triad (HIT) family protein
LCGRAEHNRCRITLRALAILCQEYDESRPKLFVAFRDIRPAAETHVLVIPRKHVATLSNCTESDAPLLGRMLVLVARLADQLGVAYSGGETGFRTVINTGPGGGQEVYHLHAHILAGPRPWHRMG